MIRFLVVLLIMSISAWAGFHSNWTLFEFEAGYLNIDSTKVCAYDSSCVNCMGGNGLVYYSTLDTDYVVIFQPYLTKIEIYGVLSDTSTYQHPITQVFRYEFMKWQEWGILDMTKDSAQHLLDRNVSDRMDLSAVYLRYRKICDSIPSRCYPNPFFGNAAENYSGYAQFFPQKKTLEDFSLRPEPVVESSSSEEPVSSSSEESSSSSEEPVLSSSEESSSSSEEPVSSSSKAKSSSSSKKKLESREGFRSSDFQNGALKIGSSYRVFDLNGNYLGNGIWKGSFKAEKPVIVLFEDGKSVVFH